MQLPLKIFNLTKQYGNFIAVKDINLEVSSGEIFGFLGPNGAGKTTTIRTIMNFLKPTSGNVSVLGLHSVEQSKQIKERVGYLAGDFELYDNLTGMQYLEFIANLRNIPFSNAEKLVDQLNVTTHKKIGSLSRGNKQKVGLASALLHDPDLLILDEPTSGLDPLAQNQFYELLKERAKAGKTSFISSHILSEVEEVCDRVAFMRDGSLVETVNVKEVLKAAKIRVTATLKKGTKAMRLPQFKELEISKQTKTTVEFLASEPVKEIISWLNMQPLQDVTIQHSSLDDIFLKLYGQSNDVQDVHA
jgi:ABC-2 type transport system ATP-binding protein